MRRAVSAMFVLSLILFAAPARAQRAGTLLAADPVVETPGGMQAWKIRYWTSDGRGRPVQATGMVVAPREAMPREPRRVLAWTHGTWGVTEGCAPSLSPNFWKVTPGLEAVRRGYVVAAPDYVGLGSPGTHPFLVGVDTARATIDAVRAASSISGAAAGRRYAVWGESQGGHAALWTAQESSRYAPELQLVGTAAAAPPTDLIANLRQAPNRTTRAFFTAFIGHSWSRHYGIPLSTIGGPTTRRLIDNLAQKCISLDSKPKLATMAGILTLQVNLRNTDLGSLRPWSTYARANSPSTTGFGGLPILIAQNPKDDLVAPAVTRTYARSLCRNRQRVRWIDIQGAGHPTSAKDSSTATLRWIDDRFAGQRAPSDCGRF